jgi:hypothetical protein
MDNPLHRGKTHADTRKDRLLVQPLERPEEPVGIRHVKPGAVVPDEEDRPPVPLQTTDLDFGIGAVCSVLPSI